MESTVYCVVMYFAFASLNISQLLLMYTAAKRYREKPTTAQLGVTEQPVGSVTDSRTAGGINV